MMNANELIDDLRQATNALAETGRPEDEARELKLDQMGNVLCRMRNALQAIAKNQAGMPSHVAQQALLDCGYCAHFNLEVLDDSQLGREHPARIYQCHDCGKNETKRFKSWE